MVRAAVDVEVELRLEEVERPVVAERAPLRVHHSARTSRHIISRQVNSTADHRNGLNRREDRAGEQRTISTELCAVHLALAVVERASHGALLALELQRVRVDALFLFLVAAAVRVGVGVRDDESGRARLAPLGHALDALQVARVRAGADDHRDGALVIVERAARERPGRVVQDRQHFDVHLLRADTDADADADASDPIQTSRFRQRVHMCSQRNGKRKQK